jgi:hypothetical protein
MADREPVAWLVAIAHEDRETTRFVLELPRRSR